MPLVLPGVQRTSGKLVVKRNWGDIVRLVTLEKREKLVALGFLRQLAFLFLRACKVLFYTLSYK